MEARYDCKNSIRIPHGNQSFFPTGRAIPGYLINISILQYFLPPEKGSRINLTGEILGKQSMIKLGFKKENFSNLLPHYRSPTGELIIAAVSFQSSSASHAGENRVKKNKFFREKP